VSEVLQTEPGIGAGTTELNKVSSPPLSLRVSLKRLVHLVVGQFPVSAFVQLLAVGGVPKSHIALGRASSNSI